MVEFHSTLILKSNMYMCVGFICKQVPLLKLYLYFFTFFKYTFLFNSGKSVTTLVIWIVSYGGEPAGFNIERSMIVWVLDE